MYKKVAYHCRHGIQITEFHDNGAKPPGEKRRRKQSVTPEQSARKNQKQKERRCERLMLENFDVDDYYFTFTYTRDERPETIEEAKTDVRKLVRQMRKAWKKTGAELRYIYNIERGRKGAVHFHMIASQIPDGDRTVNQIWKQIRHGAVHTERIREGGFSRLAAYMTKSPYSDPEKVRGGLPKESVFGRSRNLREPKKTVTLYHRRRTWHDIKVPKGYCIDEDSLYEGINPVTQWPFRRYTLLKL